MAPVVAAAAAGGPVTGIVAGASLMGLQSAGDAFDAAIQKGATVDQAQKAAAIMGGAGAVLGALPLGLVFKPIAKFLPNYPGLAGWAAAKLAHAAQTGVVFASIGEAQEWLAQKIATEYDPQAGYHPDTRRIVASLITGGVVGLAGHTPRPAAAERQPPGLLGDQRREPPPDAEPQPDPNLPPGPPHPDSQNTNPASMRRRQAMGTIIRHYEPGLTQAHLDAMSTADMLRFIADRDPSAARARQQQQEPPGPQQTGPEAQQPPPEPPPAESRPEQPQSESGPNQEYEAANAALREAGYSDRAIKRWSPETRAKRLRALGIEPRAPEQPQTTPTPPEQPAAQAQPGARQTADTGQNVPETAATLRAQQEQLVKGERAVQMFPQGTAELPLPKGMARVETPRGVFHYDPEQITPDHIHALSQQGRENEFLGLGPVSKPEAQARAAAGEPPVAVVERNQDGTEVRAAAGTAQTAGAQQAAMEGAKSPGNAIGVETPEAVVAARQGTGTRDDPVHLRTGEDVARAAAAADADHTHAQGEANNARRGHGVSGGHPGHL